MSRSSTGWVLALVSAATFATSGSFATSLLDAGWSPLAAVTARVTTAALALAVPALLQLRGQVHLLRRGAGPTAVYGVVAVAGCQLCYFNAVAHLSVGVALLLEYSGALLVVAWQWLRSRRAPGPRVLAGSALALAGLAGVLDLLGDHHLDPVGVAWGLGAAVGLAVYFVLSADTDEPLPPLVLAWGGLAVGALALLAASAVRALPVAAPPTDVVLVHARVSWLVPVLGLALVAAALAYATGIAAARRLGARLASFVGLSEVLFAVAFAWLLLGQAPRPGQLVGGLLVVAGIGLVRLDEEAGQAERLTLPSDAGGGSPTPDAGTGSRRGSIAAAGAAPAGEAGGPWTSTQHPV